MGAQGEYKYWYKKLQDLLRKGEEVEQLKQQLEETRAQVLREAIRKIVTTTFTGESLRLDIIMLLKRMIELGKELAVRQANGYYYCRHCYDQLPEEAKWAEEREK